MYTQRRPAPESSYKELGVWTPEILGEDGARIQIRPRDGDAYVVVDEIVADRVGLVIADWPRVDQADRLRFREVGKASQRSYGREQLESTINRHRERVGQAARALRIGDAFWVRGVLSDPNMWRALIDVTRATRQASKEALLRAVTYPAVSRPPTREARPVQRDRRRKKISPKAGALPPPEPEGFSPGTMAPPVV